MKNLSDIPYENAVIDNDGNTWFFALDVNALYKIDKNGVMSFITSIYEYGYGESGLFTAICEYKELIILAPRAGRHIVLVNKKNRKYNLIDIPSYIASKHKFWTGLIEDEYLYMFGHLEPYILKMNLAENEIEVQDLSEDINESRKGTGVFRKQYYKYF